MIQDAWGWCTGMTQRDGTGRLAGELKSYKLCDVSKKKKIIKNLVNRMVIEGYRL